MDYETWRKFQRWNRNGERKQMENKMREELLLEDCDLDFDGAEGGKIWIYNRVEDRSVFIRGSEILKTIEFLQQWIKK